MTVAFPIESQVYYVKTPLGVSQVTCASRTWKTEGSAKRLYVSLAEIPGALLLYEHLFAAWDHAYEATPVEGSNDWPVIDRAEAVHTDALWYWRRQQGIPNV
jgi:hypothetical protein